ncbi:MTH1187 family thiamine-binding protein [Bacillus tamaricis]|uniref:MTH1187 family thiamine-binding protein n=1 Tax=Evansella tamaricis TaxID=2069301 RepID=A0ABS6JF01_9BACI|nr:MTH1187 family thiamine-binding protein [Evansella tamaricis]
MVRGMSFQKGIVFIGRKHVACAYNDKGVQKTWLKPLKPKVLFEIAKLVYTSMPWWFHVFFFIWVTLIVLPLLLNQLGYNDVKGLPLFTLIYFFFGTHFWFPKELKKYHGAEHKVFSYKGIISITKRNGIKKAEITNRYCSTNGILLYFLTVLFLWAAFLIYNRNSWLLSLEMATLISVLLWPMLTYWLNRMKMTFIQRWILSGSYWLQKYVTTKEPDDLHIRTAIRSYRRLALKEFPAKARVVVPRRERIYLAIADITVIPIGSEKTSVSPVVAEIHKLLQTTDKKIQFELTPMSTIIEGEVPVLYDILQEIHEVPFQLGYKRVAINVRIDDRRDKESTMEGKRNAVRSRLNGQNSDEQSEESQTHGQNSE